MFAITNSLTFTNHQPLTVFASRVLIIDVEAHLRRSDFADKCGGCLQFINDGMEKQKQNSNAHNKHQQKKLTVETASLNKFYTIFQMNLNPIRVLNHKPGQN